MNKEIWKDIKGYEGLYQISNLGNVKSLPKYAGKSKRKERLITAHPDKDGYLRVHLCKNGIMSYKGVHKLIAEAFIPNINNYNQVNHKDENKTNNCIDNLEWCDCKYNINYGTRTDRATYKRRLFYERNNKVDDK